jgi:hypothetical protein
MRIFSLSTFAAMTLLLSLGGATSAAAQSNDNEAFHKRVLGYQDAETGVFHPVTRIEPEASSPATTGTIQVTLTITLKTALPKGGNIVCGADLTAMSMNLTAGTVSDWSEMANSAATTGGSTATCTVNVPYSWVIPAKSSTVTNSVTGTYSVTMNNASGASPSLIRFSSGTFLSGVIPTSGSTSKYTVGVTL